MATKYPVRNANRRAFLIGTIKTKKEEVPLKYLPFKARGKVYDRKGKR